MKLLRSLVIFFLGAWSILTAGALTLPGGLNLDPPPALDLTYQVIAGYDEKDKVVAAWSGQRLQYFIAVERLPEGWTDAQTYHAGMARDLRAAWDKLELGRSQSYQARDGLAGMVVTYVKKSTDPDRGDSTLLVHFLTDGQASFVATVSVVQPAPVARVFDESLSVMRTAGLGKTNERKARSEDAFVGTWTAEDRVPEGRKLMVRVELKSDLSFAVRGSVGQQTVLEATGVWQRRGHELVWTYMYSRPALPADRREDIDTVVAADTNIMILRSKLSGKERVYRRVPDARK